jgi:L-ribulose-5-phosphate 4-epimerase
MLEELKKQVCDANLQLVAEGLVIQTWGNASAIDREHDLVVIKPSGVPYAGMKPEQMVVVSLETGSVVEGSSSPVPTRRRIWCFTARSRTSAASSTRTVFTPRPGRRRARAFPPTARRRRITGMGKCPARAR